MSPAPLPPCGGGPTRPKAERGGGSPGRERLVAKPSAVSAARGRGLTDRLALAPAADVAAADFDEEAYARRPPSRSAFGRVGPPHKGEEECACRSGWRMRASSMPGAVPARDDTLLVAQRDVAFRQLARRGVEGRIADAAARRDRQNLLDRGPGLVPELDPERQVLAPGQVRGGRRAGRPAVLLRLA